jgi:hypothetical protein
MLKPQMHDIIKNEKKKYVKYRFDFIVEANGDVVLRSSRP